MTLAELFRGRQVLITGGLGFIGSNLAIRLVELGARVTLLDALVEQLGGNLANAESIRDRVTIRFTDLRETDGLEQLVRGQDYIFHLAGQVSHGDSMRDPLFDLGVNCLATVNLVEACRRHNPHARLLYASTRQVYGRPQSLPVNEDHVTEPIDVNGINKLAAEQYLLLYHRVYGLRSTILRLTNTYGPRQKVTDSRQGFAGYFIYQALRGDVIRLFGGGRQRRDFSYVDDTVDAMLRTMTSDSCLGQALNVGGPACSLAEFVGLLHELCEFRVEEIPFPTDSKRIDIGDYVADYSRLQSLTGWKPQTSLRTGLARTLEYLRQGSPEVGTPINAK